MVPSSEGLLGGAAVRATRPRIAAVDVLVEHPHATADLVAPSLPHAWTWARAAIKPAGVVVAPSSGVPDLWVYDGRRPFGRGSPLS
jgi:hypothetical protein